MKTHDLKKEVKKTLPLIMMGCLFILYGQKTIAQTYCIPTARQGCRIIPMSNFTLTGAKGTSINNPSSVAQMIMVILHLPSLSHSYIPINLIQAK